MATAATTGSRRLARRSAETLREEGIRALWWQVLATAGLRRLEIHCRPAEREPAPAVEGVKTWPLTYGDADRYRELNPEPEISEAEFQRRLRAGDRCIGAWRGQGLVGSRWLAIAEAEVSYLGVRFSIAPDACYFYEAFTAPAERRRGIGDLLDAAARAEAVSIGKRTVLSGLLPENRVGAAFIAPWGRKVGTLVSIRIGRRRMTWSSVPRRYIGPVRGLQGDRCSPSAL